MALDLTAAEADVDEDMPDPDDTPPSSDEPGSPDRPHTPRADSVTTPRPQAVNAAVRTQRAPGAGGHPVFGRQG